MDADLNLLTNENRQIIATRLRNIAKNVSEGVVTPDSFSLEAEWIAKPPLANGTKERTCSGRVFLSFAFWTKAIEDLL